jgi:uncharacterized protein YodC (DUF2158 family)
MTFKVGDVVQLKSGGPPMTVTRVHSNMVGFTEITCQWFYGLMETGTFKPDVLMPSKPRPFEELKGAFSTGGPAMTGNLVSQPVSLDDSGSSET